MSSGRVCFSSPESLACQLCGPSVDRQLLVIRSVPSAVLELCSVLMTASELGTITVSVLQRRKSRHRETGYSAQGHTASMWQSTGPSLLVPQLLTTVLCGPLDPTPSTSIFYSNSKSRAWSCSKCGLKSLPRQPSCRGHCPHWKDDNTGKYKPGLREAE